MVTEVWRIVDFVVNDPVFVVSGKKGVCSTKYSRLYIRNPRFPDVWFQWRNLKESYHLKDLGIDGKIILKYTLNKSDETT
jgi:hypothetical protein